MQPLSINDYVNPPSSAAPPRPPYSEDGPTVNVPRPSNVVDAIHAALQDHERRLSTLREQYKNAHGMSEEAMLVQERATWAKMTAPPADPNVVSRDEFEQMKDTMGQILVALSTPNVPVTASSLEEQVDVVLDEVTGEEGDK